MHDATASKPFELAFRNKAKYEELPHRHEGYGAACVTGSVTEK